MIIKLIMTSLRFDLGPTSKTLNLSLLWFIERSKFQNLGVVHFKMGENSRKFNTTVSKKRKENQS